MAVFADYDDGLSTLELDLGAACGAVRYQRAHLVVLRHSADFEIICELSSLGNQFVGRF